MPPCLVVFRVAFFQSHNSSPFFRGPLFMYHSNMRHASVLHSLVHSSPSRSLEIFCLLRRSRCDVDRVHVVVVCLLSRAWLFEGLATLDSFQIQIGCFFDTKYECKTIVGLCIDKNGLTSCKFSLKEHPLKFFILHVPLKRKYFKNVLGLLNIEEVGHNTYA